MLGKTLSLLWAVFFAQTYASFWYFLVVFSQEIVLIVFVTFPGKILSQQKFYDISNIHTLESTRRHYNVWQPTLKHFEKDLKNRTTMRKHNKVIISETINIAFIISQGTFLRHILLIFTWMGPLFCKKKYIVAIKNKYLFPFILVIQKMGQPF